MANTNPEPLSEEDISYLLNHVFLPPKLPQRDDNDKDTDRNVALCRLVSDASREFSKFLPQSQQRQWSTVSRMVRNLLEATRVLDKDVLVTNISTLVYGGQSRFC